MSKNIDLAVEYLQRDLGKLARWCAKWRIKLNPEKIKVITLSKSQTAIRAEPALSFYGDLLSYYPQIKFLGITFDNRMTFTKHSEEILERCNQKFHHLRTLVLLLYVRERETHHSRPKPLSLDACKPPR